MKGGEPSMKRFLIAIAMVMGLNMIGSIMNLTAPLSFAQEDPAPQPEPKPEKPDKD